MKTIISLFVGICLACSVTACGGKGSCDKEKAAAEAAECMTKTDQKEAKSCMEAFQKKYAHCE